MRRTMLAMSVALIAAGCGGGGGGAGPPSEPNAAQEPQAVESTVEVTLADFSVTPKPENVAPGEVTFELTNEGPNPHAFTVLRTDLAPDELPTSPIGGADTLDPGIEVMGSIAEFSSGKSDSLSLDLEPGHYVLICNIINHYTLGMSSEMTIA